MARESYKQMIIITVGGVVTEYCNNWLYSTRGLFTIVSGSTIFRMNIQSIITMTSSVAKQAELVEHSRQAKRTNKFPKFNYSRWEWSNFD